MLSYFKHIYINNNSSKYLFLLHGTGADEYDLLFFDELLKKNFNIVSLLGNVNTHGIRRFFGRDEQGVFDQKSIVDETKKLQEFISAWMQQYSTSVQDLTFLGYSNGANMILATLLNYPDSISHAILLHPMIPFDLKDKQLDLSKLNAFVSIGILDQVIPPSEGRKVARTLESFGAKVTLKEYPGGHEISEQELLDIKSFIST